MWRHIKRKFWGWVVGIIMLGIIGIILYAKYGS